MILLSARIADRPKNITRRDFNSIVRDSLHLAGMFWLDNYRPLHFGRAAAARYGYSSRSKGYSILKNRLKFIKPAKDAYGPLVPATKPAEPLVWRGDLKREVLGKASSAFRVLATATASRQQVRVPIRLPHPMRPQNAAELTIIRQDELEAMHRVAVQEIDRRLGVQ